MKTRGIIIAIIIIVIISGLVGYRALKLNKIDTLENENEGI